MSISDTIEFLNRLPKMADLSGPAPTSPLQLVEDFGANPGNLTMWCYVPPNLPPNSPLVVVLHGCTQTAATFDHGSGWSTLADRNGFALLYPEQRRGNNPNLCFNWFDPDKTSRGGGEVLSIHRMIAAMVRLHRVSASRIYIVGLSAGGAMASSMLAAYPEVFEGGAILAGLPHGVAGNLREALSSMASGPRQTSADLGDLVRTASSHEGRWPRISIWHGNDDRTVHPANADQIAEQWRDVHGLAEAPTRDNVTGVRRKRVWTNAERADVIELNSIDGMAHGVALGGAKDEQAPLGTPGPFMLDAGVASTSEIASFFGLTSEAKTDTDTGPTSESFAARRALPKEHLDLTRIVSRALRGIGFK